MTLYAHPKALGGSIYQYSSFTPILFVFVFLAPSFGFPKLGAHVDDVVPSLWNAFVLVLLFCRLRLLTVQGCVFLQ